MNCHEFKELAAAYAFDALEDGEYAACTRHLQQTEHDGCRELLERYRATVDALNSTLVPVPASPSVWRALRARITPGAGREGVPRVKLRGALPWALAACALLGLLWSAQRLQVAERKTRTQESRLEKSEQQNLAAVDAREACQRMLEGLESQSEAVRKAVALLAAPDTRAVAMQAQGKAPYAATVLYNPREARALVVSSQIAPIADKDFELWVIAGNEPPKPAGFMRFHAGSLALGEIDRALLQATRPAAFAVSLEPLGGRPAPTEVLLVAKLAPG